MASAKVVVVGCGVSGLSCALRLLERGFEVEIWGRDLPLHTTSNVAAALWYPYHASPPERVDAWALASYDTFRQLASDPDAGVILRSGLGIYPPGTEPPAFLRGLPGFRMARPEELPSGKQRGYVVEAPVVEMPVYLEYLTSQLRNRGGEIVERRCESLESALEACDFVVHCAGLGAREVVGDTAMTPIRGQVVLTERAGVERFVFDDFGEGGITYVVPRSNDCVLGGTVEAGRESLVVDASTTSEILARCRALEPRLESAAVLGSKVGLRPGRIDVRLEAETPTPGRLIVHNYGHGGAGVTLSWGCADEVCELVLTHVRGPADYGGSPTCGEPSAG